MSVNNDFIAILREQMYSQIVDRYLGIIEYRLNPLDEDDQCIGALSQDERHLWVLWVIAYEDLARKNRDLMSQTSDLEMDLKKSEEGTADDIRARHKPIMDDALAQCNKAMKHELGIRYVFFGALALAHGINLASGGEVYQVRKGFVLVRVPAEHGDSEVIEFVKSRASVTVFVTPSTG